MGISLKQLRQISFFAGLHEDTLLLLSQSSIRREYAPGAILFLEGDAASAMYYLDAGWVKVSKSSPEGREQILRFLGPGETFNELSIFANKQNPATAVALEAVNAWLIPRRAVQQLLIDYPQVAIQVIESVADRAIYLASLVADLSLHSVEGRVARLLLREADADVMARRPWATQTELAARLGTVPDVLSRALRSMAGAGIIAVERSEIRILDRDALAEMALIDDG
ncbi:MAG: Crp/Fnr family transcriptional regulator [Caldilineaceae bacterium]|nr:Crp/Fnr family transcriptional regulator [Caldilineaceae bacterium]